MLLFTVCQTICLGVYANATGGNEAAGHAALAFIFLYYIAYNIGYSGLLVSYSSEILPYHLRAKGLTLMFFCVDLSLWFNQYVNPIAIDAIQWKYYIVYCVFLLFEIAIVYFFFVETKKVPLEEIVKLFDGEQAILGGAAASEKVQQLAMHGDETVGGDTEKAIASSVEIRG